MWWKKKEVRPTPERMYEVAAEFQRLMDAGDEAGFTKFGIEHFEELPEGKRKTFLLAIYEEMQKTIGQVPAEEFVAARLKSFSEDTRHEIKMEVWGGVIEYSKNRTWKTGRQDRPAEVDKS